MTNKQIARYLNDTARLIELTGGNAFRARAFQQAARTIERLEPDVTTLLAEGKLTEIRGIGKGLAAQIEDLTTTGSFDLRDELMEAVPAGLHDVLRVKGLGAKKVRVLWQTLGITSLDALAAAAAAGHIATLDGFGAKTEANILEQVEQLRAYQARRRYADARRMLAPLLEALQRLPGIRQAEPAGALRRCSETVEAVDITVAAENEAAVRHALDDLLPDGIETADDGFEGRLPDGLPLRVQVAAPARFGTAWWHQTGAAAHCNAFEDRYGRPADHATEEALYAAAGLAFVPPELREGEASLDAAARDALPDLITVADLRGSLHNHTTYSDGAHTLEAMAEAARALGLSYLGICDHSQSLTIANGLTPDRVRTQQDEICALNKRFARDGGPPFRIFSGTESDILLDGALDFDDDVLASFDFVVASVHNKLTMDEEEATERILRAVENPYTTILGHPTGRLLLVREGYPLDHARIISACAAHGVAIELNANPYRLDLDWRWVREATRQGVLIAINPDAHAVEELRNVQWGVSVARKGWLTPAQCLNAKSLPDFTDWLEARRALHPA